MTGFKTILAAFDGSSDSVRALKVAENLARDRKSRLTVTYVHEPTPEHSVTPGVTMAGDPNLYQTQTYVGNAPTPINPVPTPVNTDETILEDNTPEQIMADAKVRVSDELDANFEILTGKPAERISEYANENEVDLIVIGNRGISGIKKLVMGSVSKKVTDHAKCSVFVVK